MRRPYVQELKQEAVRRLERGVWSVVEISRELGARRNQPYKRQERGYSDSLPTGITRGP